MRRIILDTNLYVDWINRGAHEDLMLADQDDFRAIQRVRDFSLEVVV
jgi:hypothetical protein